MNNNSGFSLIEMMIALFILSFSILGLTSVTITAIKVNAHNQLRNAAVVLTQELSEELIAEPIDDILPTPTGTPEVRRVDVRGVAMDFKVIRTVESKTNNLKQVVLEVQYSYNDKDRSNKMVVYKYRST